MINLPEDNFPIDPQSTSELVSVVPYLLGYQPSEAVLMVGVAPDCHGVTFGPISRSTLEDFFTPSQGRTLRHDFVADLPKNPDARGIVAIYSQQVFDDISRGGTRYKQWFPHADDELRLWNRLKAFRPEHLFIIGDTHWRCWKCPTPQHCPQHGHSVEMLKSTRLATWMVLQGRQCAPDRRAFVGLNEASANNTLDAHLRHEVQMIDSHVARSQAWYARLTSKWNRVLSASQTADALFQPQELGLLSLSLHDISLRDNVIYAACTNELVPNPTLSGEHHFNDMFASSNAPDLVRGERVVGLFRDMASGCPQQYQAPVLGVWAWIHWWLGQNEEALILTDLAAEESPNYSLILTLMEVLNRGRRPPWLARFVA